MKIIAPGGPRFDLWPRRFGLVRVLTPAVHLVVRCCHVRVNRVGPRVRRVVHSQSTAQMRRLCNRAAPAAVKPFEVTPKRIVPRSIAFPPYTRRDPPPMERRVRVLAPRMNAASRSLKRGSNGIQLDVKSAEDVRCMREACNMARRALAFSGSLVEVCTPSVIRAQSCLPQRQCASQVGITTDEIDRQVHEFVIRMGAYPSPLGYRCRED